MLGIRLRNFSPQIEEKLIFILAIKSPAHRGFQVWKYRKSVRCKLSRLGTFNDNIHLLSTDISFVSENVYKNINPPNPGSRNYSANCSHAHCADDAELLGRWPGEEAALPGADRHLRGPPGGGGEGELHHPRAEVITWHSIHTLLANWHWSMWCGSRTQLDATWSHDIHPAPYWVTVTWSCNVYDLWSMSMNMWNTSQTFLADFH